MIWYAQAERAKGNGMAKSTVQSRGQVTLLKGVREAAGISPGDIVDIQGVGPHKLLVDVVPVKPLQHYWETFASDTPYDDDVLREQWQRDAADDAIDG